MTQKNKTDICIYLDSWFKFFSFFSFLFFVKKYIFVGDNFILLIEVFLSFELQKDV